MLNSGRDFSVEDGATERAQNSAWSCFCRSGRVEDYIRYAQLAHGGECRAGGSDMTGVPDADQDRRLNH